MSRASFVFLQQLTPRKDINPNPFIELGELAIINRVNGRICTQLVVSIKLMQNV